MKGNVTSKCDIWSLGCTTIELLTGQPPYFNLNQMCALVKIVNDPVPPLPEGSSELKDFLNKCFQKEPYSRVDASELLKHPWLNNFDNNAIQEMVNSPTGVGGYPEEIKNTINFGMSPHPMINKIVPEKRMDTIEMQLFESEEGQTVIDITPKDINQRNREIRVIKKKS